MSVVWNGYLSSIANKPIPLILENPTVNADIVPIQVQ